LLVDGELLRLFDVDAPSALMPVQPSELHFLFGDALDIQIIEDTDAAHAAQALDFEHRCACALDLTLIAFDSELSHEIREEAVEELEMLLDDSHVTERLENILYARPLPTTADLTGAAGFATTKQAARVRDV
jgi:hypothetical protein